MILCLNVQGLLNKDTKWKVDMLKEYVSENNIIIMNLTETWLKEEDQDEKIPNYTTFRSDRKGGKTKGGGAAIYLRDGLEAKVILEDYVESCEIVAVHIEKINIINIVVYRPQETKLPVFTWGIYKTEQVPKRYNYSTDNETQIESKTFFYITLVPFCGKITQRYRRNQKNNVHLR